LTFFITFAEDVTSHFLTILFPLSSHLTKCYSIPHEQYRAAFVIFFWGTKKIATSDGWERVRKLAPIVFVPSLVRLGEEWPEVYSF
jgi:hypothetical protein